MSSNNSDNNNDNNNDNNLLTMGRVTRDIEQGGVSSPSPFPPRNPDDWNVNSNNSNDLPPHQQRQRQRQPQPLQEEASANHRPVSPPYKHNKNKDKGNNKDKEKDVPPFPSNDTGNNSSNTSSSSSSAVAVSETRLLNILRLFLFVLLVCFTVIVSIGVYSWTRADEQGRFTAHCQAQNTRIVDAFYQAVSERLDAVNALSTAITSHALSTNQTFPFVTTPHFEIRGSNVRVQAQSFILHYAPVVHDNQRKAWEAYAFQNRDHINDAFRSDTQHRQRQDQALGYTSHGKEDATNDINHQKNDNNRRLRRLHTKEPAELEKNHDENDVATFNETILDDGTGYHPHIWSIGALQNSGDDPLDSGPYLPLWQRSPVHPGQQEFLNSNWANSFSLEGVLPILLQTKQAIFNRVIHPVGGGTNKQINFALSQFRHETDFQSQGQDALSFFAYPVFDSFEPDAVVAGVLATNVYWRLLLARSVLPKSGGSFVCILKNSFGQTLSYRLQGGDEDDDKYNKDVESAGESSERNGKASKVVYLGSHDAHDAAYDDLVAVTDTNEYGRRLRDPARRSYTSVPLNTEYGKYTLHIYPTKETEEMFMTNKPWIYMSIVVAVSGLTSLFFAIFVYIVERRQRIVMDRVVKNAAKAAAAERDLNEFLAHEIRNPLASAMVAHSFVKTTVTDPFTIPDDHVRESVLADHKIITSSLQFIDDFLRSMLLMYRASANKLEIDLAQTNLYEQVFEPVSNILHTRNNDGVTISVECPLDLQIMTDGLRLKQVLLNLGRNAAKFVSSGFIRLKACAVDGKVELSVEDSGPGIPLEKRNLLFQKYHTTLEVVSQGNGIGLCLCKNLITLLKGDIFLDENYNSGIPDNPGARFVVKLNMPPISTAPKTVSIEENDETMQKTSIRRTDSPTDTGIIAQGAIAESIPPPSPALPNSLSVLFVDDDAILRKLFVRSLRKVCPNWSIKEAVSGEMALELFRNAENNDNTGVSSSNLFDLVFIDQYMASTEPRLLGTETVVALRNLSIDCTICGLSANDMRSEFVAAGADHFMLKPLPFERHALEIELQRITERIRNPAT